jgi:hypothetical protein
MISLREKLKLAPFSWEDFLARASAGEMKDKELEKAKKYAEDWRRCPVGNLPDILPREIDLNGKRREPTDHRLYELGVEFSWTIKTGNWAEAKKLLKQINKLGDELVETEIARMITSLRELGYEVVAL